MKWLVLIAAFFSMLLGLFPNLPKGRAALAEWAPVAVVSWGSRGPSVTELQSRLHWLGLYHGAINGIFDWRTYWAVRDFQYGERISIDGVAGWLTWTRLREASAGWHPVYSPPSASSAPAVARSNSVSSTAGISANDINLMSHVVYGESRGQPFVGQVAVAAVIVNRYHSIRFPHSIPGILFQPGAFTSISNGQAWVGTDAMSNQAVMDALNGWDPTHGALYYWNPATATSPWIWSQPIMLRIGDHVFAK